MDAVYTGRQHPFFAGKKEKWRAAYDSLRTKGYRGDSIW